MIGAVSTLPRSNMPPMLEVELKFQVPTAARRAVQAEVERGVSHRTRLRAIYFDTPDRRLAAACIALRLRHEGSGWVQTAKASGSDAMQRLEHNVALAAGRPHGARPSFAHHTTSAPQTALTPRAAYPGR